MTIELTYRTQIVGIPSGSRDVSFNLVNRTGIFDIPAAHVDEFPLATVSTENSYWHDGSHWYAVDPLDEGGNHDPELLAKKLGCLEIAAFPIEHRIAPYPADLRFREIVEDYTPEIERAIRDHLEANARLVDGMILKRGPEPIYSVSIWTDTADEPKDFRVTRSIGLQTTWAHVFRADDWKGLSEFKRDLKSRGFLDGTGESHRNRRIDVLLEESIGLDAEKATALGILDPLRYSTREHKRNMTYDQLEAYCVVSDTAMEPDPDDGMIEEALDAAAHIHHMSYNGKSGIVLRLLRERWDNRPIIDFRHVGPAAPGAKF